MAKIIDCTIFHNEFSMLDLRLNILRDHVDRFVIAEGNQTFSRQPKQLQLRPWLEENFPDLRSRIDVIDVTDFPSNPNPWIQESHQRNAVLGGLTKAKPNNLVLLFDMDEIPDVESIQNQLPNRDIAVVEQAFFYYYFNLSCGRWRHGAATLMKNLTVTPELARSLRRRPVVKNGGWHFSYLMTPDAIANKIKSFSHQEFNTPKITDPKTISDRIKYHQDLFGRENGPVLTPVALDDTFPEYLRDNQEKYAAFIIPFETVADDIRQGNKP